MTKFQKLYLSLTENSNNWNFSGFNIKFAGREYDIDKEYLDVISKEYFHRQEMVKPVKIGDIRLCYENARQEYWLQRNHHSDVKYAVGNYNFISRKDILWCYDETDQSIRKDISKFLEKVKEMKSQSPKNISHAWVQLGDKIDDPTPWDINNKFLEEHIYYHYSPISFISEDKLSKTLTYFPK